MRFLFLCLLPLFAFAEIEEVVKSLLEQFSAKEESRTHDFKITKHTVQVDGELLNYDAIAGTLEQYTGTGEVAGHIFFTAYILENSTPDRPVTFIYDGGPGASSVAMHIGGFGPRRIALPEEGQSFLPPYRMIDNQECLLKYTDLVMVDPVSTGYSQAEENYELAFFGVEADLYSFSEFIRMFCIHFDRWNSPKYLAGASYGTVRSCALAETLLGSGIYLNGIILLATALDYNTLVNLRDSNLPDTLLLPSLAATAWYHGRTMPDRTLEEVVEYARRFALEEYAPFTFQFFSPLEQARFFQKLSALIGLPESTLYRYQGRLTEGLYVTEFLANERKRIGGLDSRYVGDMSSIGSEYIEDPSCKDIIPAICPSFLNYLQNELELTSYFPKYRVFSPESFFFWNWITYDSSFAIPNFVQRLRRALIANPHMKVFVGSGYYDLRTPFGATEYSLNQLQLPTSYRKNFQIEYYPAGHGFIFDLPSLKKLKKDLVKFYEKRSS